MKNKLVLIVVIGICWFSASSQTLSPTVISSSGGFYNNSSGMLSFTVAEMTMVQTFIQSANILTQGFQQPEDYTVGIVETPVVSGNLLIYPNPTNGSFVLSFTGNDNTETSIRIFNLAGQLVMEKQVTQSTGLNTIKFDISAYSQGMYILQLATTNSKGEKSSSYHKINLVY
ncbi:MAG: T9SS type A sorting domain-containing protein [Bacteroidales bacterium]